MRPLGVVCVDPSPQGEAGMVDGFEVAGPCKLLLEGLDEAFAEPVLLGRVGGDVFLGESVVGHDGAVSA